jgi:GntR family transcriptional regulator
MLGTDRESEGIPKYIQLAKILRDKIARQEYKAEQQIPTESELCDQYKVSRITVRQAINRLVQENYLDRRQGRGTYVVHQKLRRNIAKVYSFTHDMVSLGLKPSSHTLELEVQEADPELAEKMRLPENNRLMTKIRRVRLANGTPILVETSLIPEFLCPGLATKDLEKGSLYQILTEEYRVLPHHAEETYESIIMSKKDAEILECGTGRPRPAFSIQRITYLENGAPIELTRSVGRGDLLTLAINMVADKADFQRIVEF